MKQVDLANEANYLSRDIPTSRAVFRARRGLLVRLEVDRGVDQGLLVLAPPEPRHRLPERRVGLDLVDVEAPRPRVALVDRAVCGCGDSGRRARPRGAMPRGVGVSFFVELTQAGEWPRLQALVRFCVDGRGRRTNGPIAPANAIRADAASRLAIHKELAAKMPAHHS